MTSIRDQSDRVKPNEVAASSNPEAVALLLGALSEKTRLDSAGCVLKCGPHLLAQMLWDSFRMLMLVCWQAWV